jgi:hypothetical protein
VAVKTWYATNTLVSNHQELSETSPGADATSSPAVGWVVGTTAPTVYAEFDGGTKQANSTFSATARPDGTINTAGDCLRTANTYRGTFTAGNWTIDFAVIGVTNSGAQDGRARFRLFRSANADGSSATEITAGVQTGSTLTNISTSQVKSSVTFNPGAFSLTNEYLFIQVGWEITGAGGMTTTDVVMRVGTTATVVTSPTYTNDYLLTCSQGSFTETGKTVTLTRGRKVSAVQGSFSLTGQAVTLTRGRKVTAAQGSFSLTGNAVTLTKQGFPLQGVVASWRLEETSGVRVDATGRSANALSDINTVTSATGKTGTAAQFTRANSEYLSCVSNSDLVMGDIDCTFAAWVYLDSKPASTAMAILGKWNNDIVPSDVEYTLFYNTGIDRFKFTVNDYAAEVVANNFGAATTGQWNLVIAWHDSVANTLNIQVNNGTVNSTSYSGGIPQRSNPFRLGADAFPNFWLDGRLDSVIIWKRVLSSGDRTAVWNGGAGIEFTSPIAKAGYDQTRLEQETVYLDASQSAGDGITYSWSQLSGTSVTLTNPTTATPHFTAPDISVSTDLVFRVVVEDAASVAAQDDVTITIEPTGTTKWLWHTPFEADIRAESFYPAFDTLPSPSLVTKDGRIIAAKGDITLEGYIWSTSKMLCSLIFARQKYLGNIAYSDTIPSSDFPTTPTATALQFLQMTSDYGLDQPSHSPGNHYAYNNGAYHHFGTHLKTTFYSGNTHIQTLQNAFLSALNPEDTLGYNTAGYMSGWDGGWSMSTRDLARIGQLVLNGGIWDGTQILDPTYCNTDLWALSIPGAATQSTDEDTEFYNQAATSDVMKPQWGLGFWYIPAGAFIDHEAALMTGKYGTSAWLSRQSNVMAVASNVGGSTDDTSAVYISSGQFEALLDSVINHYTLTASSGSFTESGQAVTLLRPRGMSITSGSFTETGFDVGLQKGFGLALEFGTFTETGNTVSLQTAKKLTVIAGSFSESGQNTNLLWGHRSSLNTGSLALTGSNVNLNHGRFLSLTAGSFTETGNAVSLLRGRSLALAFGSFGLTGNAVLLRFDHKGSLASGAFTETGFNVGLTKQGAGGFTLTAASGSFALSGSTSNLLRSRLLQITNGSFTETGNSTGLIRTHVIPLSSGSFTETGQSISLLLAYRIPITAGSFSETGFSVNLVYQPAGSFTLSASSGSFTLSGQPTGLRAARNLILASGDFNETGFSATFLLGRVLPLSPGSFAESGLSAAFDWGHTIQAGVGSFALSGQQAMLKANHLLSPNVAVFTQTGFAGELLRGLRIQLEDGSFVLDGIDLLTMVNRLIAAATGGFALIGKPVGLIYGMTPGPGSTGRTNNSQRLATISTNKLPSIEIKHGR